MIVFCSQDHSLLNTIEGEDKEEDEEEAITSEVWLPSTPFPIAQGKKLLTSSRCVTRDVTTHRNEPKSSSVARTEHTSVHYPSLSLNTVHYRSLQFTTFHCGSLWFSTTNSRPVLYCPILMGGVQHNDSQKPKRGRLRTTPWEH